MLERVHVQYWDACSLLTNANLNLHLNLYTTGATHNSGGVGEGVAFGGVRTTQCTACWSGSGIPQGFLPRLAGRLDGS